MLAYYPLEHLAWLVGHAVLPAPTIFGGKARAAKGKRRGWTIEAGTLGVWSCRCWAVYVVLQFAHLREDMRLLRMRERAVGKMKVRGASDGVSLGSLILLRSFGRAQQLRLRRKI